MLIPDLSPETRMYLIWAATLISGIVNSATGVGGAGVLMPIALALLPAQEALIVVALSQISRNIMLTLAIWREAKQEVVWRLAVGGMVGAFIGAMLIGNMPELLLRRTLAVGILLFVATEIAPSKQEWKVDLSQIPAVGFLTGALSALFGTTGPIAAPFLFRHGLTGIHLVATITMAALAMNTVKLSTYAALGFFHEISPLLAWGVVIAVALGVQMGVWVLKTSSHGRFRILFLGMLTLVALGYLFGGVDHNPAIDIDARMREKFSAQHQ